MSLTTLSARELARRIAEGSLTAVEVVEAHILRIEAENPALGAVVWTRFDAARDEAREVDRRRQAGEPLGKLAGVPITVKECLDLEGSPSTFGVTTRRDHRAARDDVHVRRLRDAGAIVLGKTNVAQLLMYVETDNPLYGLTRNPRRADRSPGGSSGGQAAIVAAGGSPFGLGTDIGGSCRVPAAFCGVVGFKPTAGRANDSGIGSIPVGQQAIASQVGVIARDVGDAVLALELATSSPNLPALGAIDAARPLRVGWFDDDGLLAACPAARRAVREAVAALGERGAVVRRWEPPPAAETQALFYGILSGDGLAGARRFLGRSPRDPHIKLLEDAATQPRAIVNVLLRLTRRNKTRALVNCFGPYDTDTYWTRVAQLGEYRERVLASLGDLDAIVSPATALPAVRHGATAELGVMGTYSYLYNTLGWPAGVVPWTEVRAGEESDRPPSRDRMDETARACEEGSAGLPIGVQVAARAWQDHVALGALAALESINHAGGG